MKTTRIRLDRIASSTRNARLGRAVIVGDRVEAREGFILAVRLLNDKSAYNNLEDPTGRMIRLHRGDVLAGTLGTRRALRGYAGIVPESIAVGERVHVLNLGGVLGRCTAENPDLGPPFETEVLGAVLSFPSTGDRLGVPARIDAGAIPPAERLETPPPLILVAGTCMNSGKTVAAAEIVRGLCRGGTRVAALKLTGVSLRRDTLAMMDAGAVAGLSFNDAGIVSTHDDDVLPAARGLLNHLAREVSPDVIVAELGDGLLGEYGVGTVLADGDVMAGCRALVVCAPDQVGAWGAVRLLEERFRRRPEVVTGPVTDNDVGTLFVRSRLDLPAHNARRDPEGLVAVIRRALGV